MMKLRFTTTCSAKGCSSTYEEDAFASWDARMVLPRPSLPQDWMRIGELTYCSNHDVELFVDGRREQAYTSLRAARTA